jgi:hypothetical protein
VTIDELIELDDLGTPASTISSRRQNYISESILKEQQRERTSSDISSQCSFGERSVY